MMTLGLWCAEASLLWSTLVALILTLAVRESLVPFISGAIVTVFYGWAAAAVAGVAL